MASVITIINLCQTYHNFPHSGGLLDQDYLWVHYMRYIGMAQEKKQEIDSIRQQRKVDGQHSGSVGYPSRTR